MTPTCVSWDHLLRVTVRDVSQRLCGVDGTRVEDQTTGATHLGAGQQLGCELAVRLLRAILQLWTIPCVPESSTESGVNTNSGIWSTSVASGEMVVKKSLV